MKTLSPQAKEMIQRLALKTGVSEEILLMIYLSGFADGVMDLCRRQLENLQSDTEIA